MASEDYVKILKAIRSLRKVNPLRKQATIIFADPTVPIEDLEPILSAFKNWSLTRKQHQAVAAWLIAKARWSDRQRQVVSENLSGLLDAETNGKSLDRGCSSGFGVALLPILYYIVRIL